MPQIIIRGLVEGLCIGVGEILVKKAYAKYEELKALKDQDLLNEEIAEFLSHFDSYGLNGIV